MMDETSIYPRITVVTPNYNQGAFIERTIRSVLGQKYPNLEYIIIDGASTDSSIEVIKKYEKSLAYWISESDEGMYYAINKGFQRSTGEIMCWINSDDVLMDRSLFKVAKLFSRDGRVNWLQGKPSVIDEHGKIIKQPKTVGSPYHFYLGLHNKSFSFIQQESTFWSRKLWEAAGGTISIEYRLASDFDLWMRFFKHATMFVSQEELGAFRRREGQLSSNGDQYLVEANAALRKHIKERTVFERFTIYRNRAANRFFEVCPFHWCKKRQKAHLKKLLACSQI